MAGASAPPAVSIFAREDKTADARPASGRSSHMAKSQGYLKETTVLDKGYVRLIDLMGSDQRVVEAARVSTGAESDPDRDKKLIFYLMEHRHETPFEKIVFEFAVKCPLFVARQWARHRIGSFNERSARYRVFDFDYYVPSIEDLPEVYGPDDIEQYVDCLKQAYELYEAMLAKVADKQKLRSRAREVFRGLLGAAFYTEFYWTVNFRSLMNFISLRADPSAQLEIRRYAMAINDMVAEHIPWSHEAFETFVLGRKPDGKEEE